MSTLNEREIAALHAALEDEHHAWATYDQVIRDAESRHIDALVVLFERYGVPAPANPWPGRIERYPSLYDARVAAVAAETANAALYERLLASMTRPDILAVFGNLQEASEQRHLRAFQRCVERRG
jgi:hypothetical protein